MRSACILRESVRGEGEVRRRLEGEVVVEEEGDEAALADSLLLLSKQVQRALTPSYISLASALERKKPRAGARVR